MSEMYGDRLLEHYRRPRNQGELLRADLEAEAKNTLCGDRVQIQVRLSGERIEEACFVGRGCALCLGAASILTEFVSGRSLSALRVVGEGDFLAELGAPIRPARLNCALLPWVAFRKAAYGEDGEPAPPAGHNRPDGG